jgi:hypothetical protein
MATDVIIEPGSGQIYWNDGAGSPQSISIKGDAQNTISVVGYSGAFSPGSSAGGTFVIASFNDNSGTAAFVPGTTNYDLGSTTYRWSVYGYTGNFSSDVVISSSTQSTSVTSGALRVNGGVGISGRMYFNTAAMGTTGIASPPTFAFIGSTGDPIYLQVLEDNSLSFEGSQGQLFSITPNLSTGYIYSVNDITGIPLLRANANANVTANEFGGNFGIGVTNPGYKLHVVGSVGFTSVTASTTPTSGTLVVSGGAGIGQTLNIGGRLNLWNSTNTNFTSFVSTATGNTVYNLPATTPSTGSSVLQSDSVGNLSWVGFVANSAATATTAQNLNTVVANTSSTHYILFSPVNGGSGVAVSSDSGFTVNPVTNAITATTFVGNLSATASTSGFVGVTDNTASTSTTTGALVVTGGVGIGQSVIVGGRVGIGTNLLTGALNIQAPTTGTAAINIRGNASQTADVISTFTSTGSTNFAVNANGRVTLTGLDGIWNNNVKYNIFDVSAGRVNWNLTTWQYSSIYWTTAAATIGQAANQLQFSNNGTSTVSGVGVLAAGWDTGGANRVFGILTPAGTERSYFRGYGNLVINPNNPNALHTGWNTMDLITLDISGTASTYSGNIILGKVEGTERFSVGPFGNTKITVGSATTATGFIVKAVASQSGNLIETQSSAGATNFYVTPSGAVSVGSTAISISTSSGALTVAGGVGIGGTLFTGSSTADSISGVVLNNGVIASGSWAGNLITAVYGGTGYSTYTKGDLLVGAGSTFVRLGIGSSNQVLTVLPSSGSGYTWTDIIGANYGSFYSTTTQVVTAANTETLILLSSTYEANNVSRVGGGTTSRIQVARSGIYNIQFSAQINLASGTQPQKGDFWFKVNGSNVPQSNTEMTITGKDYQTVLALNFVSSLNANDYFELAMSSANEHFSIEALSGLTSPTRPDVPSIILSVTPVSETVALTGMASTGIYSLNGLDARVQALAFDYSGTLPVWTSNAFTHTLSIPLAGSASTGLISTNAQTIAGVKTFTSPISGTATTSTNTYIASATSGIFYPVLSSTSSSAVGIGLSVDGTDFSYNAGTNVLTAGQFSGNVSATGITSGLVSITSSTASTYMANGALTVAGGVGISGQLSYNRAAIGYTGIPTNPTMAFIGTTGNPITLTVLADNGLQFEGTSGKLFGINNNLSTGWIFNVGDISGIPLIRANADGTVAMGEFAGNIGIGMSNPAFKLHVIGSVGFTSVTASTSPTTGTLVVSGGVGVGQTLSVGGRLHLFNGSNFTAFQSASSGNHTYTLPANVPSTGTSVLQADTSGILSWVGFSANSASIATTAQNLNTVASTTSASHFLLFSPTNGASGVAVSSDAQLTYNPATDVLSASVFSGNVSATAVTSTNFFGTLTGNVTGNLTGTATTSQNVNTVAATTSATHYLTFSPVNGASGVALSSDVNLTFNPSTNVLTTDIFSGNVSATAVTSTNFFGTLTGNVTGNLTGTATTSQNVNLAAGANNSNHSVVFSLNATGSGVALSSDAGLQYNPSTNVLTADTFSGNVSATAITATNFYGTFQGSSATAVTSRNINTTSATTAGAHYLLFSPVNATTSGVAVSSDSSLQYNPATNVLTVDVFSGNHTGTAFTATNFYGTLTGNVTGNLTGTATTAQNVNTVSATTSASHFITFSPVNGASGVALSSDANLTFNPSTNVLTTDIFSGNVSATAVTSTNFYGTLTGNVTGNLTGTATTAQNINLASGANNSNHSVVFSLNATGTGIALSSDAGLQYNPSTNVLTADVFSGNHTGTAFTATNFYGTHVGNVTGNVTGTATTAQNINTVAAFSPGTHYILFSPVNATASGVAVSSDVQLQFDPGNNVLTTTVFSGNLSATAATATNFYGTLVGNSSTATTASNLNVVSATTNSAHYITFSPASSGSGLATSADTNLSYNPSTNVLTAGVFSGNFTGTAATATNFYGTLVGNSSTATTAQNVNLAAGANAANHSIVFSLNATGSGVALSSDAELQYNPSTNALSVGTGSVTANSVRIGNSANTVDTSSGNLTLDSTGGQVNINDNVVIQGNLTVQGTTLTVDSTITTIVDPVIVLGSGIGGTHSTADNNQDRGIEFRYSNGGTAVTGYFGFQDTDYKFRFIPNATISGTNVYSGNVGVIVATLEGNVSATAVTATNFYGTLVGNTATATTSQNINSVVASTNSTHYLLFSPVNGGSGVAVSSDSVVTVNPSTNVLSAAVFSGNFSGTAATATNFYGTLTGNVSGNVTGTATTAANINTSTATTAGAHYILFSPVNATASGVAVSSDSTLQFNPGTNVLTVDVFSGNLSATAATATNFYGTHVGNVTGTSTTSQNINTVSATTSATHYLTFSPVNGASGVALSSDAQLTYNPATNILSATTFSGNVSGTAITATNFYGTLVGNSSTATTAQNINVNATTINATHYITFAPASSGSGLASSTDTDLTYNPGTNVLTAGVFNGNHTGTAFTATNFYGTLTGNVTGNVTGTATTATNLNTTSATTAGAHYLLFSPVNATASGVAVSSDSTLQFNPATNVLTTDIFSGNISATAATATNFYGTLVGNSSTATTANNINVNATTINATHYITFAPASSGSGLATSTDTDLSYNPGTNVLTAGVFSGNVTGTAITATNFYGTLVGNSSTATTSSNVNTVVANTNSTHYVVFSPVNGGSGVALSTDSGFTVNSLTNVVTAAVFSGNLSATAATSTNFYGALTGNVTGTATTATNINTSTATTAGAHYLLFSPVNATASGVAVSSDSTLQFNPATNVLSTDVFSGNLSATAATATNFYGTLVGNSSTATTAQNININATTINATHYITFASASSGSGLASSTDTDLTYNPGTNVLTAGVFSGNVSGTAITATNFYGTLVGSVGTATTSQNVNTVSATTNSTHYLTFSPVNGASGVALSSDTQLTYNPSTNVLTAGVFSGNVAGTAITATNFYGTLTGNVTGNLTGTATTSQNVNLAAGGNNSNHSVVFSLYATGTGVGLSSDAGMQYNPATHVLTVDVFSGNHTGTAFTATNFYGTLTGNVTGNLTGTATTSQNINTTSATTSATHYLLFSPVNATTSGVAVSSDGQLTYNPATDVLSASVFSGNHTGTAFTATNFYGTLTGNVTGNVTGTATTATNINLAAGANNSNHSVVFSLNATGTGIGLSSDAGLQYNPATNVLSADVFSGNHTGTAFTATNFYGTLTGNVTGNLTGTATTSQNVNTVSATTSATHYLTFSPVNGASGVALSSDAQLTYNPATNILSATTFSGNVTGTAITATNFYGTLVGSVGTATTSQNVNTVSATTSASHFLLFSPVNGASGVAVSSDAQLTYNPATDVLSVTTFSGNVSGTAITATNFYGTLTGNVTGNLTGTATTAQNVNLATGANNSNHSVVFSLNATGTGVGLSSDASLQYNPSTNVLTADVFSGNHTGTAFTATNFYGTLTGNVTGNVTGTATTSQNVNTVSATTSATHYLTFSPVNGASGVALSSDAQLTYNPATDVLSATTFSGNVTGTAITATNFYGTLVGSVGSATTSQNINTTAATTAGAHYLLFSPVNATASGVAVSSDAQLQFNPATNVLTADVFSGNLSATASTSVFGRVTSIVNTTSSTTGALVVSGGVGIGGSMFIDGTVKLNYTSGNALNVADRVVVSTTNNFEGLNVNSNYSFAFNVQDKANNNRFTIDVSNNKTYLSGSSASHELRLYNANQSTYTGFAASNSGTVTYILPAGDGSSGQVLATNGSARLYWSTPSAGSGGGSSGVNPGAQYQIAFYSATGSSVDGSTTFTNNTSTSTVSIAHATSSTATNVGALVVTGGLGLGGNAFIGGTVTVTNSTASNSTATGAVVITGGLGVGGQINSASLVTSGNAVISGNLTFNGVGVFGNATSDTVNFNARLISDFVPNADATYDLGLNTLAWRNGFIDYITGIAITSTNFYGTLIGNASTATTAANINTTAATTAGAHYLLFSPVNATTSGVAVSSDAQLQFNPGTNVLTANIFSGNLSGTAATVTNFYGTLTGNVTGTATTAQNINTVSANTNATHYLTFSPANGGSGVALSTDTNLTFNSLSNVLTSSVFSGNLSATAATSGLFAIGNLTYSAANLLSAFQTSVNSYSQFIIQNSNNGASASIDFVVNNDTSTDIGRYGNFGMNSSGFTGSGSTGIPNAVYLTSTTSELVLGTTTNNRIRFVNENIDTFQITGTGSSVYTTTATTSKNSGAFVVAGGAAIGLSLSVGQGIQLYNSTNGNHTGFKAGATSSNSVYTLPLAYPSTGSSILQSDTSGTMIWVNAPTGGSATPAGNNTELQYNNSGAFGGATGLTWQSVNNTLQINSNATHTTSAQVGLRLENGLASGGQATRWSPTFEMAGRSGVANVYFSRFATEVVPSGPATYASALRFRYSQDQGTASFGSNLFSIHSTLGIGIGGSTVSSNFMSYIRAHESQAADIFYRLPLAAPGTGASFLQCDTSGNMSWVNSPGGGSGSPAGSPKQIQFNNNGAFGGAGGFEYISVGGTAVTVSMFSLAGGGYTSGLWVNVLSASSTKIGIGLSNPQYELEINGELSATNKSFVIDHPTKPGMKLRYGSLEGPENGVYVRGELKGTNIITVPDHWIGLVHEDSYTVHLTPIGRYSQLYVEKIENYNVYIADNSMNPIHCYYSVWAERKDIPKLVTEY